MERLEYERDVPDLKVKPKVKDAEFVLIKAIENLTEAIITLQSRIR